MLRIKIYAKTQGRVHCSAVEKLGTEYESWSCYLLSCETLDLTSQGLSLFLCKIKGLSKSINSLNL